MGSSLLPHGLKRSGHSARLSDRGSEGGGGGLENIANIFGN